MSVIHETEDRVWRIIEVPDPHATLEDLKGDLYDPKANSDTDPVRLREEELAFERDVELWGVNGYILGRWDGSPGVGYETIDSVWGFVGPYSPKIDRFNHYIVDEFKTRILKG